MSLDAKIKLTMQLLLVLEKLNNASKAMEDAMKAHKQVCSLPTLLPEQEAKARDNVHTCVDVLLDLGLEAQRIAVAHPELRKE